MEKHWIKLEVDERDLRMAQWVIRDDFPKEVLGLVMSRREPTFYFESENALKLFDDISETFCNYGMNFMISSNHPELA